MKIIHEAFLESTWPMDIPQSILVVVALYNNHVQKY
jgi:hypothetical protein